MTKVKVTTIYIPESFEFIEFKESQTKFKKYDAIIKNKETEELVKIPFGDKRRTHYKDVTGLGTWSHKDHNDEEKRKKYRKRHAGDEKNMYSDDWFSYNYLW